jgi:soluble calcium-activated nucleotidase 1
LGAVRGERGFSAFQFLPGSHDDVLVALKSEERDGAAVASYLFVYRLSDGFSILFF